jgi:hypothetical protein
MFDVYVAEDNGVELRCEAASYLLHLVARLMPADLRRGCGWIPYLFCTRRVCS